MADRYLRHPQKKAGAKPYTLSFEFRSNAQSALTTTYQTVQTSNMVVQNTATGASQNFAYATDYGSGQQVVVK